MTQRRTKLAATKMMNIGAASAGNERALESDDFEGGTDQNESVDRDEPGIQRLGDDGRTARHHRALMIARNAKLDDAKRRDDEQQR